VPRKQSIKLAASRFVDAPEDSEAFLTEIGDHQLSKSTVSRTYEWALVEVYRAFES